MKFLFHNILVILIKKSFIYDLSKIHKLKAMVSGVNVLSPIKPGLRKDLVKVRKKSIRRVDRRKEVESVGKGTTSSFMVR